MATACIDLGRRAKARRLRRGVRRVEKKKGQPKSKTKTSTELIAKDSGVVNAAESGEHEPCVIDYADQIKELEREAGA